MKSKKIFSSRNEAGTAVRGSNAAIVFLALAIAALASHASAKDPLPCAGCAITYPYTSTNPLTCISFSESELLRAFNTNLVSTRDTIRAWYNDEHALMMGVRRVIVKSFTGTTTNDYAVTPLPSNPGAALNPAVGTLNVTGDQAGTDISGRPMYPALFITDTTVDLTSHAGDWQFGGTPIPPHAVFGTWKSSVRNVDKRFSPPVVTITTDPDPAKNNWNLGAGDPAPPGLLDEGYGAEVRWNVADLGLIPGHSYRLYFMIHDGDQLKSGGDAGQGCLNISVVSAVGPSSQTRCPGDMAQFSTIVDNAGSYAFSWLKNGVVMPEQTTSILTLKNIAPTDAGTYTVIVSSPCGSVTNCASLVVNQPIAIVQGPTGMTVCPGAPVNFTVTTSGPVLGCHWYKAGVLLGAATNLSLSSVTAADSGVYSVVVNGACQSITNNATLIVNSRLLVSGGPMDVTTCAGSTAAFSVSATGTGLSYQWFRANALLAGSTASSLALTNVSSADSGRYSVVVIGACGSPITNFATLTVNQPLLVLQKPADVVICEKGTSVFSISATGSSLAYQWYKGATLLANQTGPSLTLTNVAVQDAGTYLAVVHGLCGGTLTNSATLSVNQNISVIAGPANLTVCEGTPAAFMVNASGTGLSYQWFHDAKSLSGQTMNTLSLTNVSLEDAGSYQVRISGTCGASVTNSATLSVNARVSVAPLAGAFQNLGTTVRFTAIPSGAGPLACIWKKDGQIIADATLPTLTISNLAYADAGMYTVEVSGQCGTASQSAPLAVNHPPTVNILSPTNGAVFIAPAAFTVLADAFDVDGTVTNVEFYLSGTNKIGQCATEPYFVNPTNLAAGTYTFTARATDDLGATGISPAVQVTVLDRPPLQTIGGIVYSPQLDFFIQTNRVFNPTYSSFNAVRIYVYNLTNVPAIVVHDASGYSNNIPYVETRQPIPAGSYVDIRIEYASPLRIAPNPILKTVLVPAPQPVGLPVASALQPVHRTIMLANKSMMLEFASMLNRVYDVQYSHDLKNWSTAVPALTGSGGYIQWVDSGAPKTDSSPANHAMRFYRLVLMP